MMSVRSDLAIEAHEDAVSQRGLDKIDGVDVEREDMEKISVVRLKISSDAGARELGREKGNYVTIEIPSLQIELFDLFEQATDALAKELKGILPKGEGLCVLVAGLGNRHITPDALGPIAIDHIVVTRHLRSFLPDTFGSMRPVAAMAPGVLGITGMETSDVLNGICEKLAPDIIIIIDALAARELKRLNTTIQICDTGITPGSGVGNDRSEISSRTFKVPVIAIGVPTVVDALTLSSDIAGANERELSEETRKYARGLVVTPKDVDKLTANIAKVVAYGVNKALHGDMETDEIAAFLS